MALPEIIQKEAGQSQRLTTLLRDLVRRYPKNIGIFNEYLQNADDAGASVVEFILDHRTFPCATLPVPEMAALMGPALLVYNNSVFDEDDFTSIQEIGDSGKTMELAKAGRFGFGFNASYNITDFPSFVSGEWLYFFDPHQKTTPGGKGGVAYKLTADLWEGYPDLLRPFQSAGLEPGTADFRGTIFRLPLRTAERAPYSLIRTEPFTPEDFRVLVARFGETASAALIFLKHLVRVSVYDIPGADGARSEVLSVETENTTEVNEAREALTGAVASADASILEHLAGAQLKRVFEHRVVVRGDGLVASSRWQVASGFYFDSSGRVLAAAHQMFEAREKAIPWVGVAARLESDGECAQRPQQVHGQAFCFLPLPIATGLPVHIHGFFDLGSDRQTLTHDPNSMGRDEVRVKWNELLCQLSIPMAYRDLIIALVKRQGNDADPRLYDVFPDTDGTKELPLKLIGVSAYKSIETDPIIRCATKKGAPWAEIKSIWLPPSDRPLIQDALVADGLAIPEPPLPQHVRDGFTAAGVKVDELTSDELRLQLQVDTNLVTSFEDAPRPCFSRRDWVEELLRYCLSDLNAAEKIAGLPLALLADGNLHTFGPLAGGYVFLADDAERSICKSKPSWFIESTFATDCAVPVSTAGRVARMTPANLALNLRTILDPEEMGQPAPWEPDGDEIPNAEWLAEVFAYLTMHHSEVLGAMRAWKVQPPLLPDQHGRLCPANFPCSPLFVPPELASNRALMDALDVLTISRIVAPASLRDAIDQFAHATNGAFVHYLTGPNLVSALKDQEVKWKAAVSDYRADVHDPLLDFLADDRWSYSQESVDVLRSLVIFPTEDGQLVSLTAAQVFVTPDDPPQVPCDVKLLKLGKQRRWRSWLRRLDVKALDHATLIRDVLLPKFSDCDAQRQHALLRWIRDHLRQTVRQLEGGNEGTAITLRNMVADATLFRCSDGRLRSARSVYDPNQRAIQDILGDDAPLVDLETYRKEWDEWLSFLQYLGMPPTPLPEDLVACIDQLVQRAGVEGVGSVREKIDRLFRHLAEHWEMLANATVCDANANDARQLLSEALANRAWLVAEAEAKRTAKYAGFSAPEQRLYRPAELYPIRLAHLCASQRPVSAHPRVLAKFMRAIGMPASVPDDIVLAHFEHLLSLWALDGHAGITVEVLQPSLRKLYARLGGAKDADDSEIDEPVAEAPVVENTAAGELKQRFAGRDCLWHPESRQFWRPEDAFRTKVPFFAPHRVSLKMSDPDVDRGYEALGRRDEPGIDDYVRFLRDMAEEYPEMLPPEYVKQVLEVEVRLAHAAAANGQGSPSITLPRDIPLLTTERRFVSLDVAYYCDAEWHLDRLEPGRVHVLYHPGTDYAVAQHLEVVRLSMGITERLLTAEGRPSNEQVVHDCERWQRTLRSPQFKAGIVRLLRCSALNDIGSVRLDWLESVEVRPVGLIRTELLVDRGAGLTTVGASECDDFVDHDDNSIRTIIFLSESADVQLEFFLARAIIRELKPLQLERQPELQQIIDASPENIESLLTRLRVPLVEEHDEESAQPQDEDKGFEIPSDDNESVVDQPSAGEQSSSTGPLEQQSDAYSADDAVTQVDGEARSSADTDTDDRHPTHNDGDPDRGSTANKGDGENWKGAHSPKSKRRTGSSHGGTAAGATPSAPQGSERRSDDGPPTEDTHGKTSGSSTREPRRPRGRALTFVVPENATPAKPRDPGDDEQLSNMKIGQAAVDHVLRYEREVLRRNARGMSHNNAGYDVTSTAQDGRDVRYIEVKGIDGPWPDDGVPLSKTQFEMAQKFQEAYWLYVVENARSDKAQVHPIQNPAKRVTQFRFDPGWREMALGRPGHPAVPAAMPRSSRNPVAATAPSAPSAASGTRGGDVSPRIGDLIRWSDGREGNITNVQQHGKLCHLHVRLHLGGVIHGPFDPAKMTLL